MSNVTKRTSEKPQEAAIGQWLGVWHTMRGDIESVDMRAVSTRPRGPLGQALGCSPRREGILVIEVRSSSAFAHVAMKAMERLVELDGRSSVDSFEAGARAVLEEIAGRIDVELERTVRAKVGIAA